MNRPRTVLLAALVSAVVAIPAAVALTMARADTTEPVSDVDACPAVPAPLATCFAKVHHGGITAHQVGPDATPSGFGPADLVSAYQLPGTGGTGQTVAIVDAFADPNAEADLATYRSQFGLPACTVASGCLSIVNQGGATSPLPTTDAGWSLEISLDLDMVSAICPNCHILLVEADSNDIANLGLSVDTAVTLGANVVSNSYGSVEFAQETEFTAHYNHPGHAIVASAGDAGYGAAFPAVLTTVTAVGGTTLSQSGSTWSESVWSGTGSGCSAYIAKPAWQTDAHCPMRMMNDVAAVADPATGVAVYDTVQQNGWLVVGGTSASAPIIGAVYALTGLASQVDDGSVPWNNHPSGAFRDVTTGTNVPGTTALTCGGDYLCTGTAGYDGPTGWGTPLGLTGLSVPAA